VAYRLRMSGEIHDWLADLHDSEEALGGRLEIIAEFAGDRVVLR
jgi:hypothetical protein